MYTYNAKILNIVDGDTADLSIDLGFDIWQNTRVRFYGINAPEVHGESKDAGLATKAYVASVLKIGDLVKINTYKDKKEKYGRYLAEIIYTNAQGQETNLNNELVDKKLAVVYLPA